MFVAGTGTNVGKTVVASTIAATLATQGQRVAVFKPVVTGLNESGPRPPDHELLRASARSSQEPEEVAPYRFDPPLSPHLAAEISGVRIEPGRLVQEARRAAGEADTLIVEGVGGLLVPLSNDYLVRDFAIDLGLPLVIASPPALGTINHSLLTLEAARAVTLDVAAVVLTPWPSDPVEIELSNRVTIARLGRVEVVTLSALDATSALPPVDELPIVEWLSRSGSKGSERSAASL